MKVQDNNIFQLFLNQFGFSENTANLRECELIDLSNISFSGEMPNGNCSGNGTCTGTNGSCSGNASCKQ